MPQPRVALAPLIRAHSASSGVLACWHGMCYARACARVHQDKLDKLAGYARLCLRVADRPLPGGNHGRQGNE